MRIEILGAESFGGRSLCSFVETKKHKILIDPAVSLAPYRSGLRPHPMELAASKRIRTLILKRSADADVIVLSHYHHDHYTPPLKRIYEWSDARKADLLYRDKKVFIKNPEESINRSQRKRASAFLCRNDCEKVYADNTRWDNITFSPPFPHGENDSRQGFVIMTVIDGDRRRFCHASDIQCLDSGAVDWIIDKDPDILLVSGPPFYHKEVKPQSLKEGRENLQRLALSVPLLIVDHHSLRSEDYLDYLRESLVISRSAGHRLMTAAEFMEMKPVLLEARRKDLYREYPVEEGWLRDFFEGAPTVMERIEKDEEKLDLMLAGQGEAAVEKVYY